MRPYELTARVSDLEAHYGVLRNLVSGIEQELTDKTEERTAVEADISKARTELENIRREVAGLSETKAMTLREIDYAEKSSRRTMAAELEAHNEVLENTRNLVSEARNIISEAVAKKADLEVDISALRGILREIDEDITDDTRELEILREMSIEKSDEIRDLEEAIEEKKEQLDALAREEAAYIVELHGIEADIEARREEFGAFHEKLAFRESVVAAREKDLLILRRRFNDYSMKHFGIPISVS